MHTCILNHNTVCVHKYILAAIAVQVLITNSTFVGSQADSGAAFDVMDGSSIDVYGSNFVSNNASVGGVLLAEQTSRVVLDTCMLDGNTAVTDGGVLQALERTQVGMQLLISNWCRGCTSVTLCLHLQCRLLLPSTRKPRCAPFKSHLLHSSCGLAATIAFLLGRLTQSMYMTHVSANWARLLRRS